jgi:arylsulfatase A-like enzyme
MVKTAQGDNTGAATGHRAWCTKRRLVVAFYVTVAIIALGVVTYGAIFRTAQGRTPVDRVIVIVVDTLRSDHVSALGYRRPTTPILEKLIQTEATAFENAYSSSSWTLPSTVSLMTGLHPHQHGVEDRGEKLHPEVPTLAGAFSGAGYTSAAFVTHIYVSSLFGIDSGFDDFNELSIDWKFKEGKQLRAEQLNADVFPWLAAHRSLPFFLYLHYFDPHWDYDAPAPFKRRFVDPKYHGRAKGTWRFINRFIPRSRRMSAEDLAHVTALYDGEIAYTDSQLGLLFDELKRLGMWDTSAIVVLSDHGEELQDHGSMHHIRTLYEEVLRVPLIIKLPGGDRARERATVAERVRTFDVGPTLLDLAGIPIPSTFQSSSLLPVLARQQRDREIFARTRRHKSDSMAIIHGDHKLIVPFGRKKGESELYDLRRDAHEKRSLAGQLDRVEARLRNRMRSIVREDNRALSLPGAAGGVELTEEQKAGLEALGYLER